MAAYRTALTSATAAVDWHNLRAAGGVLAGSTSGRLVIRTEKAARVAIGVTDPGTSTTAGIATVAGEAVELILGAAAAAQTIWVQTPADQTTVYVEIDETSNGPVLAVFA